MANLKTKYMGLELKNPVIVGASNLVNEPDNLKKIEDAGAAAIVYKSLFEEQVQLENLEIFERKTEYEDRNAEMITLFPSSKEDYYSPLKHLLALEKAKESLSIPVFASLNAVNDETWVEYARDLEETGVDGLELNFYTSPEKAGKKYTEIEKSQLKTLAKVKAAVKIPIALKLSPYYTNPLRFIADLEAGGADAFVLFNRLFQPDINIDSEEHVFSDSLSHPEDSRLPMRFAGMLYGDTNASVCANSGIFDGHDVIRMILAGAGCVQVVSTLYLNGIEVIGNILKEIDDWMVQKGYENINSVRGKLSRSNSKDKLPYTRAQFIDFRMSTQAILNKYRIIS